MDVETLLFILNSFPNLEALNVGRLMEVYPEQSSKPGAKKKRRELKKNSYEFSSHFNLKVLNISGCPYYPVMRCLFYLIISWVS